MTGSRNASTRSGPYGWHGITKRLRGGSSGRANNSVESLVPPVRSSAPKNAGAAPQQPPNASKNASAGPQQQSYAQAARSGSKRLDNSAPVNERPQLVRGSSIFEHTDYLSMERPAPPAASNTFLYVDLRLSDLTAAQALDAAQEQLGDEVVGFQYFAGQHCLALMFSTSTARDKFEKKSIGKTDLVMYAAPSAPRKLMKLTLQGVPLVPKELLIKTLTAKFAAAGELVFLAPLMYGRLLSDQWHATIAVSPDQIDTLPPDVITIADFPVIVDIPGERRWCKHCNGTTHVKASCRQGQRIRQRQRQQQLEQQRLDELLGISSDSSSDASYEDVPPPSSPPPSSSDQVEKVPPPPPPTTTTSNTTTTATTATRSTSLDNAFMEGVETGRALADRIQEAADIMYAAQAQPGSVATDAVHNARMFLIANGRDEFRLLGDQ
jgi:hypothetical protein